MLILLAYTLKKHGVKNDAILVGAYLLFDSHICGQILTLPCKNGVLKLNTNTFLHHVSKHV